jgi:flagellar basal body-associated protein FliL
MPDEAAKPDAASGPPGDGKKKKSVATFGLFGGVMIVEGLSIFMCMRFFGSHPDPTLGVEGIQVQTSQPWKESAELEVAKLRVQNSNGSRTLLCSVTVVVRVHQSDVEKIKEFLENRKNTINDALSRIIRSADEKHLNEPGLETLKRQFRFELSSLINNDTIIEQVLIPECMPLPTGF